MIRFVRVFLLLVASLLVAGLVACGDGDDGDGLLGDEPTAAETEAPEETDAPAETEEPSDETALNLLVEGDFAAPDSHAFTQRIEIGDITANQEVVIIGDDAWIREGEEDWTRTTAGDPEVIDTIDLTSADPSFLQDQTFLEDIRSLDSEAEEINGVQTRKYTISQETIEALGTLFGEDFLGELEGVDELAVTFWVDEETEGLVRAEITAVGGDALIEDAPFDFPPDAVATLSLVVNLTDINEEIEIAPPVAGDTAAEPSEAADLPFDSFHYTVEVDLSIAAP